MNITEIEHSLITHRYKGIPGGTPPFRLVDIGQQGWNILRQDLPLPLGIIKQSALLHNSRWMQAFLNTTGVDLAPHGKTSMSPQLFKLQLDDGAWGITAATVMSGAGRARRRRSKRRTPRRGGAFVRRE